MNTHLLIPFLTGQRRAGLGRVNNVSVHPWEIVDIPEFKETLISDANEKLYRMAHIYASLADKVQQSVALGNRPVCIAGDCFSALGVLAGLQKARKPPDRILWLDAHGDFHTWGTTISKYLGGMPLAMMTGRRDRRIGERDSVNAFINMVGLTAYPEENIILSDARDLDPGEKELLESSKIVACKIDDIHKYLSYDENIHLHFDTDVIDDRVELPALKYHVEHGPSRQDILSLFRYLSQYKLMAISVSAWHEEHDMDNKTAISCLSLLKELE